MVVDEWCEGYMRGVGLAADEWRAGAPEIADLLAPIRAFTEETDWLAHEIADLKQVEKLRDAIAPNVRAIHANWLARRAQNDRPRSPSVIARRAWDATTFAPVAAARSTRSAVCNSGRRRGITVETKDDRECCARSGILRSRSCDGGRWCCSIRAPCIPSGSRCPVSRMWSCTPKSRLRNAIRDSPQRRRATSLPRERSFQNS